MLPAVATKEEYVRFSGGLDQLSPAISIPPGAALTAHNYVPGVEYGYERIKGIERYNGKPSPSDATYLYCTVALTGSVSVGDTITGVTSSATGLVVVASTGVLVVTKVTGSFSSATEYFQVAAVTVGAFTSLPSLKGYPTGVDNATALNLAADEYRADIAAPTGSGAIRGLGLLRGVLYCFVDNAGGTAGLIYKATASGWSAITLYQTISFTGGNLAIADGATITQAVSGATGVVKRQVLESGSYAGSNAAGRFILTSVTGTFDATNALQTGAVTRATASSLLTAITIAAGGRYEIVEHNFSGSTDTIALYGADGVNKAFEFDGDVYIPINTGMTTDTPLHIVAHKKMLMLTFRSSLQNSAIGYPFQWTAISGAAEIATGQNITGMLTQPGDVLAIATRNSTYQLQGSSTADFVLAYISNEVGAIPYSLQNMASAYWLDDRGVMHISRTLDYGNFNNATVSRRIQTLIDAMRIVLTASSVSKTTNQIRFYGSDGTGIAMAATSGFKGIEHEFTSFKYPINVNCAVSGEDANGKDVVFLGGDDGMVYQADKGTSFDGVDIEAFIRLPFNHSKSPSVIKQYRKAILEMSANGYSEIRIHPDFSYGNADISQHQLESSVIQGTGGVYDVSYYEACYYDSQVIASPEMQISGSGTNMSLVFYCKSQIDQGHTLHGVTIHYTPRRLKR